MGYNAAGRNQIGLGKFAIHPPAGGSFAPARLDAFWSEMFSTKLVISANLSARILRTKRSTHYQLCTSHFWNDIGEGVLGKDTSRSGHDG